MTDDSAQTLVPKPGLPDEPVLALPRLEKGIGAVIAAPDSGQLIDGVKLNALTLWPDDRGYFMELVRFGQGPAAGFPAESAQLSCAVSYPGTIKAFHFHRLQADLWCPVSGMLQVALVDLRRASPTFGLRNTLYVGALRPWQILVPPGVGHGYKVVGAEPAALVYLTSRFYNPADEGRIPYNDPGIAYDWETQHK